MAQCRRAYDTGGVKTDAQSRRAYLGLGICLGVGTCFTLVFGGLATVLEAFEEGPLVGLGYTGIVLVLCVSAAASLFLPYGFIALGWLKIGDYKRHTLDQLGDDNTVGDPEAGERKYQQWITAVNSPEAYLGLVPRSADYVAPEQRPPADAKPPRSRLSAGGWRALTIVMALGAIGGVVAGSGYGIGQPQEDAPRLLPVLRLFVCSLIGAVLAAPIGVALALAFGRIEDRPEDADADDENESDAHDAGTGGPEAT